MHVGEKRVKPRKQKKENKEEEGKDERKVRKEEMKRKILGGRGEGG